MFLKSTLSTTNNFTFSPPITYFTPASYLKPKQDSFQSKKKLKKKLKKIVLAQQPVFQEFVKSKATLLVAVTWCGGSCSCSCCRRCTHFTFHRSTVLETPGWGVVCFVENSGLGVIKVEKNKPRISKLLFYSIIINKCFETIC